MKKGEVNILDEVARLYREGKYDEIAYLLDNTTYLQYVWDEDDVGNKLHGVFIKNNDIVYYIDEKGWRIVSDKDTLEWAELLFSKYC
jgi:hypothetical protein